MNFSTMVGIIGMVYGVLENILYNIMNSTINWITNPSLAVGTVEVERKGGLFDWLESIRILDIKILDAEDFSTLLFRFFLNFFVVILIVRYVYYPNRKDRDYFFTFIIFNVLTFFVCHLLSGMQLEMGFAFGIFALFSLLRYRTNPLPVKEMTYLFTVIVVAVINALSTRKVSYIELFFTNFLIFGLIFYLERIWFKFKGAIQVVTYEKIENIKPENKGKLIADLEERTGLNIIDVEVNKINFLNDTARISINYLPAEGNMMGESARKAEQIGD